MVGKEDKSLVAWYRMEDSATDEMGNFDLTPTDITYTSGGSFSDGKKAAVFDGSTSKMLHSGSEIIDITNGVTIAAWVYLPTDTGTGNVSVCSVGVDNSNKFELRIAKKTTPSTSDDGVRLGLAGFDDGFVSGAQSPPDINKWYHVMGTWDGTIARVYLDGVLILSEAQTLNTWDGLADVIAVGCTPNGAGLEDCRIDDVRIYTRALNDAEAKYIMHGRGFA